MRRKTAVCATAAFHSTVLGSILRRCTALSPVSSSRERHNFVSRSAPFHQQLCRHRGMVTAKQNLESTYYFFPDEHVDGSSPEELCPLVPARVQQ